MQLELNRDYLTNLADLHNSGEFQEENTGLPENSTAADSQSSEQQFVQILLVDVDKNGLSTTKMVYGEKSSLEAEYGIAALPSNGVKVAPGFASPDKGRGKYSTVRFLLQCRKLSQMMVYSWVDEDNLPEEQKIEAKLIREIFHTHNIVPDAYFLKGDDGELAPAPNNIELQKMLKAQANEPNLSYLIKPEYANYNTIRLALLLCGQAYYKASSMSQYRKIGATIVGEDGIFSTYETIWEYAMDVSWDSFYATRIDISQAGLNPNPPFTRVTLGYPARPSEFNVSQAQIKHWAFAPDEGGDLPFYPPNDSPEREQTKLEYVVAPYPYLPLSCT